MKQYLDLVKRIINEGVWVENERTGSRCLTVINADFVYDVDENIYPLVTTRQSPVKLPVAELLGYWRGYNSAADFRSLGTHSWDENANNNKAWLANPNRKGEDDMGRVYGAIARDWPMTGSGSIDTLRQIYNDLHKGYDSRGEILSFWNPGEFHLGCLRPCLYEHQFSILGDTLYLNSTQRSVDVPLGLVTNMQQCFILLNLMAQITGLKPGKAYHKLVNCHIYENQLDVIQNIQIKREPFNPPRLVINPDIKTFKDVETWVTVDDFAVHDYKHWDKIHIPFSV